MALYRRSKNTKIPLLRNILNLIPKFIIQKGRNMFLSDKGCHKYFLEDQLISLMFGQLSKCYTLGDISIGISPSLTFLKDIGLSQSPGKSTMSAGNAKRDYRVFEYLFTELLKYYRKSLEKNHQSIIIEEIKNHTIKIIDSTTISLCLSLFDWAKFRTAKGGLKIHTVWDENLALPEFINITTASVHDSKGLSNNIFKKGTIIVEDRGYFEFKLFKSRIDNHNIFVTRIKDNTVYESIRELELPEKKDQHILKDEIIKLTSKKAKTEEIDTIELRRVVVFDPETNQTIEIITNQLDWLASTIASLYKKRWAIELFFKAMKQNLQIKTFLGCSENAVKSQIYVAMITYLLLELTRRVYAKGKSAFSTFVEKIRICIMHYKSFECVFSHLKPTVQKVKQKGPPTLFDQDNFEGQIEISFPK